MLQSFKIKLFYFVVPALIVVSCHNRTTENSDNEKLVSAEIQDKDNTEAEHFIQVNDQFQMFADSFPKAELPLEFDPCLINTTELKIGKPSKYPGYLKDEGLLYRQLPSNGSFLAFIQLGYADCWIPKLITFKPTGRLIQSEYLGIGRCGSDCGYTCKETISITSNLTIYAADSITLIQCEEEYPYNEIEGTEQRYVLYREGKISEDGTITISEEIRKDL